MFLNQAVPPPCLKGWSVIFFGGDVNIGRRMNWNPHAQPFGDLQIMSEADLRIINLECVIAAQGKQGVDKGEGGPYYYHARPEQTNLLTAAQIDVALTANNHSLDYYEAALLEQNNYLDRAGILHCGAGKNLDEAARPLFIKVNELVVALFNVDATMKPYAATADKPGTFYLPPDKPELWKNFFAEKIAAARKSADVILIATHWGKNGVTEPTEPIKILGRLLIDLGADAVLGCHSHFLHGVETYKDRPIIYDAGNFLFDSTPTVGGAFSLVISPKGVEQIFFVPLTIDFCRTFPADGEQAEMICGKFLDDCHKLNTAATVRRSDLIELKFTPPARTKQILKPVELSKPRRDGEKILPMQEPLPEWIADKVPDDARIEPRQFGALKLLGCRVVNPVMKRRQILYVETWWTLDASTDKDFKFQMLAVPTVKDSMANFGAAMEHQGCDWLFPTNRWKAGVIYYERFGLRPPPRRELVNVDLSLKISVLDGRFNLGSYIHPTTIQLRMPNRPLAIPNAISPPVEESIVDKFKRKFKANNGVIFFMLRNIKRDASGLELSALRRATLFKNYLGCEVFLLTNEYQNNLVENFSRYDSDGIPLNMYDYFQGISRINATPRRIYIETLPEGWRAEQAENFWRIYRQDGTLAMYATFMGEEQTLNHIEFFDEDGKKFQRDTYDALGFLSRRQILDTDSGAVTQALYYKSDGSFAIKESYELAEKKSVLKSIEIVGKNLTVDNPRKLIRYWLEHLTANKNRTYFLIGDRSPEYTRFYAAVKQRELKNIFVLHQLHNLHVLGDFDPMTAPTKRWYNFLTDKTFQSDAIITLTEQQKADVVKRYGLNNVIVLPHSVPKKIPAQVERDPYKIIMVGRLVEQKAPDKAIEAFKIVREKIPQATLHFYGTGSMLKSLKRQVKSARLENAVIFEGFVKNIDEVFSTAALFVLTSRYEGFPLVIQECLQNNCPVVAFDCRYGPREVIADGVNGYLVPVGDVEALADKIIKFLTEPGLREKLSVNCARSVERFYSEVVAEQWAELFCRLMK